jgi:hypothetical protein
MVFLPAAAPGTGLTFQTGPTRGTRITYHEYPAYFPGVHPFGMIRQ